MDKEQLEDYKKYLKSITKAELIDHAIRQMYALYDLEAENERIKEQSSRSNASYLSACHSVGGITLPPGQ